MFITLSIVLERMRYEGVVDIFQTVKMLRTQRPAMVQTEVRRARGEGVVLPLEAGRAGQLPTQEQVEVQSRDVSSGVDAGGSVLVPESQQVCGSAATRGQASDSDLPPLPRWGD